MSKIASNEEILEQFKKAIAVLEVKNENRFRIRAYQTAIEAIENLDEELSSILKRKALNTIPGIGIELRGKITDIITKGETAEWQDLFMSVPQGMFSLLNVPGIGPKRAYHLADTFHLDNPDTSLDELKTMAKAGKISLLTGFGKKLEQQILENLDRPKAKSTRMRLMDGEVIAVKVVELLKTFPEVEDISVLGSLRRREETVGDVDVAVATHSPTIVTQKLQQKAHDLMKVEAAGNNVVRLVFIGNKQADIKFQTPEKFGATMQHFTGSKFHNIALREFALQQQKSLSEHGIKYQNRLLTFAEEKDFYQNLGLDYIPPELRQNNGEIEAALTHVLPTLVQSSDIMGDFHTHTDFGWRSSHDYGDKIESLLDTAARRGYEWIGIGDHTPSRSLYAPAEISQLMKDRNQYIDKRSYQWQKGKPLLNIFKTMEVDIGTDGQLSLSDEDMALLDCVIVSIHSQLHASSAVQTKRILTALAHPKVKILGHPTGRIINDRPGIQADWIQIFDYCARHGIAVEINAQPSRLDLPDMLARQAIKQHVILSINTDAHIHSDLDLMPYGVDVARRAWATKNDIINTYTYNQVKQWLITKV